MSEHYDPIDELFDHMFRSFRPFMSMRMLDHEGEKKSGELMQYRKPVTDLFETDKEVVATFELPGVTKQDIHLNVHEDNIEVKVEKKSEEKKEGSYKSSSFNFYRSMSLPANVNSNDIKATYNNGVLEVRMPKVKEVKIKGKQIKIE